MAIEPREKKNPVGNRPSFRKPTEFGNARWTALLALCDVSMRGAYANLALDRRLKETPLTVEDRRFATRLFYTALEKRVQIDWVFHPIIAKMPQDVCRDILHIAAAQILYLRTPDHAAVDEAVRQVKRLRLMEYVSFVNGSLRSLIRAREAGLPAYPDRATSAVRALSVSASVSEPLAKRFLDCFGYEEAERILLYQPDIRQETIRRNYARTEEADFESLLNRRGWNWSRTCVPGGYFLQGAGDLSQDPAYLDGLFSIQSLSSMLAVAALDVKPGQSVFDACAAPGGKSAMLAERMRDTGRVYAMEIHPHRAELIRAQLKRLKLFGVRVIEGDATLFRAHDEGMMDAVLIDAPCTGLGMLSEKPEMRFTFQDSSVAELTALQARLLDTCYRYVKPGGVLVYSTCSILPEENERMIKAFLASHPDVQLDPLGERLPEAMRSREQNGMLQLFPQRDEGFDGFFIARLKRSNVAR